MKVVELNSVSYLAEDVVAGVLVKAMKVGGNSANIHNAKNYIQQEALGTLQDISFGNAVITTRELTPVEAGNFTIVNAAMVQATDTALAVVINSRLDELLGEF